MDNPTAIVTQLERYAGGAATNRALCLLEVAHPGDVAAAPLPRENFVCLLLWDVVGIDAQTIDDVASHLLQSGAVYVCAWGTDCNRVHDIFDEAIVGDGVDIDAHPPVITTWHAGETLDDALEFAITTAHPDSAYEETCRSVVAFAIGNANYADRVRVAFRDPRAFIGTKSKE